MTYCIGLMSGTSMDGIDAVLVAFDEHGQPSLKAHHSIEIPPPLLAELHRLCTPHDKEIDRMGRADRAIALAFAEAVHNLLAIAEVPADEVAAIGSHGQTVRHMPEGPHAFTLQLGCPSTLAAATGIDVVADFRRKDIALGGQGAPLVPAFHQALFATNRPRMILNIGGIANLTCLPGDKSDVVGFDTGPGNTLMDAWAREQFSQPFDDKGAIAASGQVNPALLTRLLSHPYFAQPAPKSTGRELFNASWLRGHLQSDANLPAEDVMATLLALTVETIAQGARAHAQQGEIYLCGGGAFNDTLRRSLATALPGFALDTTEALGLSPKWVEATAFAWLAWRHLNGLPSNLPAVTGAKREAVLGGWYPAQ
ncbi:anhydro-N-acetylmuramic acid kinase [Ferrimonas balearica]|uniref:anhydro-N-acetylmuramic acid kinase n=1 Tax=Ferrimonas balearica TaxID=44012 RepID=UPI001C99A792|nr:anhydro-N-acetylmuramic acid kinase [Ferrimonas balearica]MBY5992448.1 anhydro-N-acetylmuramic acid kinase [Ferrimonas balearica]